MGLEGTNNLSKAEQIALIKKNIANTVKYNADALTPGLVDKDGQPVKLGKTGNLNNDVFQKNDATQPKSKSFFQKISNYAKENASFVGGAEMGMGIFALTAACAVPLLPAVPAIVGTIALIGGAGLLIDGIRRMITK